MDEQQIRRDLDALQAKVQADQDQLRAAEKELKQKEAAEAAADKAEKNAKAERDHAQWHIEQDFDRIQTERTEEAWAELKQDQAWRDRLQQAYDTAAAAHGAAETALGLARLKEEIARDALKTDEKSRDEKRALLDQIERERKRESRLR